MCGILEDIQVEEGLEPEVRSRCTYEHEGSARTPSLGTPLTLSPKHTYL